MADRGRELTTGDATYQARYDRWEYIMGRLAEPKEKRPTYRQLAVEVGVSFQNIARIVKRGEVKPSGRQPSNDGRKARLMKKMSLWTARRGAKLSQGLPVEAEDRWIAEYVERIKALG